MMIIVCRQINTFHLMIFFKFCLNTVLEEPSDSPSTYNSHIFILLQNLHVLGRSLFNKKFLEEFMKPDFLQNSCSVSRF
jgi:hypothetical protein